MSCRKLVLFAAVVAAWGGFAAEWTIADGKMSDGSWTFEASLGGENVTVGKCVVAPKKPTALDFSKIRCTEAPAGKYGRVVANGGHFEFERRPGVPVRFYGINVCGDANTIPLDEARKFAANLARLGYNAIRIHHHDAGLAWKSGTEVFDAEKLDRLDYFLSRLFAKGLYVTTDLYVSRPVEWKDLGIDRPGKMSSNAYKVLVSAGYGPAVENWKRFAMASPVSAYFVESRAYSSPSRKFALIW